MVYIIVLKTPGTVHLYNSFLLEEIHTLYLQLIFPHGDFFMIRRRGGGDIFPHLTALTTTIFSWKYCDLILLELFKANFMYHYLDSGSFGC